MISDITKRWIGADYVSKRQAEKVVNRTIRRDLDALSAHFQWLIGQGRIDHNRVRDYDIGQLPELHTEIRVPSVREIQFIIDLFHRMPACFTGFQALSGLRQSEAAYAEWNEVDLDAGSLIVPKSKSNSPRTVHLFKSATEILRSLPKPPNHESHPRGGYIFWHGDGLPYSQFGSFWWEKVTNFLQMGVRDHDLRHFFAWLYLRRGGSLEGLMGQMGHADIATTQQYAHMASDLGHWDLVMMGERVTTVPRPEQFDFRFSFEKCGPFVGAREAQARSRRLYAQLRAEGKGAAARSKTVAPQAVSVLEPASKDAAE
jgi:integrase